MVLAVDTAVRGSRVHHFCASPSELSRQRFFLCVFLCVGGCARVGDALQREKVEDELELVAAMKEQMALQRQLLQYEYGLASQEVQEADSAESGLNLQRVSSFHREY